MSKSTTVRSRLVDSIRDDVAHLVKHDRFLSLEMVMEGTGYLSNRRRSTSEQLGAAIVALAGILEMRWLKVTAAAAAFERVIDRTSDNETRGDWDKANTASQRLLSGAEAVDAMAVAS